MLACDPVERAPPADHAAARAARRVLGGVALVLFAIVFFRLWFLQVLSRRPVPGPGQRQPRARRARSRRRAATSSTATARTLVDNRARPSSARPAALPAAERAAASAGASRRARLAAPEGPQAAPGPMPPIATAELRERFRRARPRARGLAADDPGPRDRVARAGALRRRDDQDRRPARGARLPARSARTQLPGRRRRAALPAPATRTRRSPPSSSGTVGRDQPGGARRKRYKGVKQGTVVGQNGLECDYDRYLRGRDGAERSRSTRSGSPKGEPPQRAAGPGRQLQLSLDLGLQKAGQEALARRRQARARRARSSRWTRATARCWRWAPTRASTRNVFSQADHPASLRRALRRRGRRAALQPRDRRLVSDGLDVQADHRARGAATGLITPPTSINDTRLPHDRRRPRVLQRRARRPTARSTCARRSRSPPTSSSTCSAQQPQRRGRPAAADAGRERLGLGPHDGHRPARRGRRPDPRPRLARGAINARGAVLREAQRPAELRHLRQRAVDARRQRQPRRRPGRPAGHAAADGGRLLDARQRRQGRRARTSASRSRTPRAGCPAASSRAAPRKLDIDRRARAGDHGRACTWPPSQPGGTSDDVFKGWPQDRYPVYGKTGTAERNGQHDQSWYVAYRPATARAPPIVVAVTIEQRRLRRRGRGARRARRSSSQWFGQQGEFVPRELADAMSTPLDPSAIADADAAPRPRAAAGLRLPFDPLLLLAALGLCACSLVSRSATATQRRHRRATRTTTSSARRSSSASAGRCWRGLSRVDYSRLRELQVRASTAS